MPILMEMMKMNNMLCPKCKSQNTILVARKYTDQKAHTRNIYVEKLEETVKISVKGKKFKKVPRKAKCYDCGIEYPFWMWKKMNKNPNWKPGNPNMAEIGKSRTAQKKKKSGTTKTNKEKESQKGTKEAKKPALTIKDKKKSEKPSKKAPRKPSRDKSKDFKKEDCKFYNKNVDVCVNEKNKTLTCEDPSKCIWKYMIYSCGRCNGRLNYDPHHNISYCTNCGMITEKIKLKR